MSDDTTLGVAYVDEDWPHGLRCAECHRLMQDGDRYSERLQAMSDNIPVASIVCVGCAIGSGT